MEGESRINILRDLSEVWLTRLFTASTLNHLGGKQVFISSIEETTVLINSPSFSMLMFEHLCTLHLLISKCLKKKIVVIMEAMAECIASMGRHT